MNRMIGLFLRLLGLGTFSLLITVGHAKACGVTTTAKVAAASEIERFFEDAGKQGLTFIGYSGAEYENPAAMLEIARRVLGEYDPVGTIVNIGATPQGIGAVYEVAKQAGFQTTGIVSTQAQVHDVALAPCVEHVFYVEDDTWGGFINEENELSPTSSALVRVSDVIVGIGGGEVGRDELLAALSMGTEVRFFSAQMNHQIARDKADKKGLEPPTDFSGAAANALQGKITFQN